MSLQFHPHGGGKQSTDNFLSMLVDVLEDSKNDHLYITVYTS
jgi:hypothetical protein